MPSCCMALPGVGKLALAERFAQLLLCEKPGQGAQPCGACEGCRWFLGGKPSRCPLSRARSPGPRPAATRGGGRRGEGKERKPSSTRSGSSRRARLRGFRPRRLAPGRAAGRDRPPGGRHEHCDGQLAAEEPRGAAGGRDVPPGLAPAGAPAADDSQPLRAGAGAAAGGEGCRRLAGGAGREATPSAGSPLPAARRCVRWTTRRASGARRSSAS